MTYSNLGILGNENPDYHVSNMIEIERKFLVNDFSYRDKATSCLEIAQGFLNTDPERTIRIRKSGDRAWITVKGKSENHGTTRQEWEYEIPIEDATAMLMLCEGGLLHKIRYRIPAGRHTFEVDEFMGDNYGLILAEVELSQVNEDFEKPSWLGNEVTGNPAYYNSQLSLKPFKTWKE